MLNEEICKLRDELNNSITSGKDYNFTYRALLKTRHENKDKIVEEIVKKLSEILEI